MNEESGKAGMASVKGMKKIKRKVRKKDDEDARRNGMFTGRADGKDVYVSNLNEMRQRRLHLMLITILAVLLSTETLSIETINVEGRT